MFVEISEKFSNCSLALIEGDRAALLTTHIWARYDPHIFFSQIAVITNKAVGLKHVHDWMSPAFHVKFLFISNGGLHVTSL